MARSEALKKAQKKYYQKIKDLPEYKEKIKQYQEKSKLKYKNDEEYRKKKQKQSREYYYKKKNLTL